MFSIAVEILFKSRHLCTLGWFQKKNSSSQGANERVLPTDFRSAFIFFLTLMVDFSFPIKVFKNQRDEKNLKKIDFYV